MKYANFITELHQRCDVRPTHFYSINGLGIPTAGGLFSLWVLFVSIALLIRARSKSVVPVDAGAA